VEGVLEQSVRREAAASSGRKGLARLMEKIVLEKLKKKKFFIKSETG